MVFYFESATPGYKVYMGKDKFENEGLIKWGWRTDIWFHVEGLSSAHVYLRVPLETAMCGCTKRCGCLLDRIPEDVIEEMCQLVKANSIEGCKLASVMIVYTPHSNLHKDETQMQTGAVGFHNMKIRRLRRTNKDKGQVKRIEKTRSEAHPDLQSEKLQFDREMVKWQKLRTKELKLAAEVVDPRKEKEALKAAHNKFLESGGYHSNALSPKAPVYDPLNLRTRQGPVKGDSNSGLDKGLAMMSIAAPAPGKPKQKAIDDEFDEKSWQHLLESMSWEAEAKLRRHEPDSGVRWLCERGFNSSVCSDTLAENGGDKMKTLAALQPRAAAVADASATPERVAEERAEEREALEAIYEELEDLGGGSIGVPVVGFETEPGAPPLKLEVLIDEAAKSYPLGGLPLLAAYGGGLLESELRELTTTLAAHAAENIDMGQLVFELTTIAGEKATELYANRENETARRKAELMKAALDRASAKKAAATSAVEASPAVSVPGGRKTKKSDAMARLGNFAPAAAAAPKEKKKVEPATLDDLFGSGAVDKGDYVKKKKKKR